MIIPIQHENMSARRWPIVTLALILDLEQDIESGIREARNVLAPHRASARTRISDPEAAGLE